MKKPWAVLGLSTFLLLTGCAGVSVDNYRGQQPGLDFATYFNGTLDGWGMVQDRSGEVIKRFHVVVDAHWETRDGQQVGTLDEHFSWADGTRTRRVWTVTRAESPSGTATFIGRADDVVGTARGEAAGNALRWQYVLSVPVDGRVWNLSIDDWMFLVDDKVMLNRSTMRKFGLHLGDITLSFTRREPS